MYTHACAAIVRKVLTVQYLQNGVNDLSTGYIRLSLVQVSNNYGDSNSQPLTGVKFGEMSGKDNTGSIVARVAVDRTNSGHLTSGSGTGRIDPVPGQRSW